MGKELLFSVTKKDLNISYFSGTGAGGQHRNRHMNCVRLQHRDSNVIVTGQSYKEKQANTKEALNNLLEHPKFKLWMAQKTNEAITGKSIEKKVDDMMSPENLKVEGRDSKGRWQDMNKKEDNE